MKRIVCVMALLTTIPAFPAAIPGLAEDERVFLERLEPWLHGAYGHPERKPRIEAFVAEYERDHGVSPDQLFEVGRRTLSRLLEARDESIRARWTLASVVSYVTHSGHPDAVVVLEDATFAVWNTSRASTAYDLVVMSPESALRLLRRMAVEGEKLDCVTRASIFGWIDEYSLSNSKVEMDRESRYGILESLKMAASSEDYSSAAGAIDRALAVHDPSWRGSAEREAMAKRFLATYIPKGEEHRWPELAMKVASEVTEEVRRNIHNRYTAVLADVETARKEAAEKEAKSVEASQP